MLCIQRALDAKRFEKYFLSNGFTITKNPKMADYILFITCAFRNIEKNISLERITQLKKYKAELIIGGCLKGICKESLDEVFTGKSFTTSNLEQIDEIFPCFKIKFRDLADVNFLSPLELLLAAKNHIFKYRLIKWNLHFFKNFKRYIQDRMLKVFYLRTGWGCIGPHCTYCVIWRAIGELKSKPLEECLKEFREALRSKYKRIVLVADNLGAYGLDSNQTLPGLLNAVLEIKGNYTLHLRELHPMWIIRYLNELIPIVKTGKISKIECPVQSGSDRILQLMNRQHNCSQIRNSLAELKKQFSKLKLYTYIMLSYPSETEEDFEATLNFAKDVGFDHVFALFYNQIANIVSENSDQKIHKEFCASRGKRAEEFFIRNRIPYTITRERLD